MSGPKLPPPFELPPLADDVRVLLDAEKRVAPPAGVHERVFAAALARIERAESPEPRSRTVRKGAGGPLVARRARTLTMAFALALIVSSAVAAFSLHRDAAREKGEPPDLRPTLMPPAHLPSSTANLVGESEDAPPLIVVPPRGDVVPRADPPASPLAAPTVPAGSPASSGPPRVRHFRDAPPRGVEPPPSNVTTPPVPLPPRAAAADQLASERALLDDARTALANGDASRALAAIDRHAHEYPEGALSEEREAMAIKGLVKVQRYDEARARGAKFRELYPRSVMTRAVESALGTIP